MSEKEAAKREMAMAQPGQQPTIMQQMEQKALGDTKQEIAQQVGGVAQKQEQDKQQAMQRLMSGIAQAPGAGQVMPARMASGGIVAFQNLANITGQGYNTAYQQAGQMFTSDQARALQAAQANQAARQAAGQQALSAAQLQAQYGLSADQAQEASRQFAAQQGMTAAQQAAQYGQAAQQAAEQSRQFGAQFGLGALRDQLGAAQAQSALARAGLQSDLDIARQQADLGALQRGITSEGIAADLGQFREERDYPYKQVQYMQSLLQGLPIAAQSYSYTEPSVLDQMLRSAGGVSKLIEILTGQGNAPATGGTTGGTTGG